MSQTDAEAFRRALEVFTGNDLQAFMDLWSDDVVWRIGGQTQFTGTYRGKDEVLGVCKRYMEVSHGTLRLEALDALTDEGYGFAMTHATAERDGKTLDVLDATFFTINENGKWSSCWWVPNDQKAFDEFWS